MEICKTDVRKIIQYLDDAAKLYDRQRGQRYVCRAEMIRRVINKLNNKLIKDEENNASDAKHIHKKESVALLTPFNGQGG